MPYSVPDGFFDSITEKTLEEALLREKSRRKHFLIRHSMAIAASLTALIATGYLIISLLQSGKTGQDVQNITSVLHEEVKNEEFREVIDSIPVKNEYDDTVAESKAMNGPVDDEGLNEVLTSLTDEELVELAAILKSDMFLEETDNNLQ